jgi:hypothetical protein
MRFKRFLVILKFGSCVQNLKLRQQPSNTGNALQEQEWRPPLNACCTQNQEYGGFTLCHRDFHVLAAVPLRSYYCSSKIDLLNYMRQSTHFEN